MSSDAIQLDEWVVEIGARSISHEARPSMDSESERWPSIYGNWQCWDDFRASFIPEIQKWQVVACMTHWYGLNVRSYLEYMQTKLDLAWSYYRGVDEKFRAENSKGFIEHLLIHSCFLIFAMVFVPRDDRLINIMDEMSSQNGLPKGLTTKDIENIIVFITEDPRRTINYMLTMNYQIPWFVVEVVYTEFSNLNKLFDTPIHKIAISCFHRFSLVEHPSKVDGGTIPEGGFKHLLHIFHWSRTPHGKYSINHESAKLIGLFHIPSATKLQLSQTAFVKDESGGIDVSYSDNMRLSRVMQLTPWHLFQTTTKIYENLLIFEQEYTHCGFTFTAYVACMTCLLKTEEDVRVLRENDIIPSTSLDDKDVLRYVQKLKTFIPDNLFMPNELIILEEKVMAHYQRSAYRLYGEFKKRYCSNLWITASVVAGICLFVLTILQTLYSMLTYYHQ